MDRWNHDACDRDSASSAQDGVQENVQSVPVSSLNIGNSLRQGGINTDHARALAESVDSLPPILVHRGTMRVIDGLHRLMATEFLGRQRIDVRFFDGDEDEAFVEAVQANVAHGLPLTLAERTAAAARVVRTHAEWSDRRIAAVVGLSPKTVGAVRARSSEEIPQTMARVGRDGRVRRLPERKRRTSMTVAADDCGAANSSSAALPRRPASSSHPARQRGVAVGDYLARYQTLRQDPSFRSTETGRFLLRLLELHFVREREWDRLIANVPPHQADSVADLARECAKAWLHFADRAEQQGSAMVHRAG
ncbi:ParB N-terminal domain-containing protein [Streptomyces lydicus]|uniref:ParB N-terminal domain-containing protein n=1 Tax=Streptomyces lydicus TaxID=47763 RepID=UPI0034411D85